jgi:CYTH domain-containing protein
VGTEIERKFLVADAELKFLEGIKGKKILQGYVFSDEAVSVRVRTKGDKAFLTIKSGAEGISRAEFEYEIPWDDAEAMLAQVCRAGKVVKTRYELPSGPHVWEVDVFEGALAGLVVAEIELSAEDEAFVRPVWLGPEVSHDARYLNARLALDGRPV